MSFHPAGTLREGAHYHVLRIYYEDTDAGGVVYHATYLRLAERARTEALRDLGVPHADLVNEHGLMFMVRRVKIDYAGSARLDDLLAVTTRPLKIGAASVDLRQSFTRAGSAAELVAVEIQLACVRLADQRPARIPPKWREALSRLAG